MLTKLVLRNFKLFDDVTIDLGARVVFVGPNNAGKSSALQGLALWNSGVRRWVEKRGTGSAPRERAGVTINRRDLIAVPVPTADQLWRNLHVREGYSENGKSKTKNVLIDIFVEGIDEGVVWNANLEFDYANEESFYCRAIRGQDGNRQAVPRAAANVRLAYLPPMSGLAANETRLDQGAVDVRIGEGRTAEVLRNLCWTVAETNNENWNKIVSRMKALFGVEFDLPLYIKERGEIVMTFRNRNGVRLDLSSSGRGQQQTLLLLAHMAANPGSVLLLDEPDAHLEVLRQRQIYQVLTETAGETGSQIIAASHSEVILDEAADRDMVIAFVGKPHRIDDRGSQLLKSLKEIGFEHYLNAEENGWVLYLEGSTDLAILQAFAEKLDHPVKRHLERPFVHYTANQPNKAQSHFRALRDAYPRLIGVGLYDRLERHLPVDPDLVLVMWAKKEIENYLCQRTTLLAWAEASGREMHGELFGASWQTEMQNAIESISGALAELGKPDPWSPDIKCSEEFFEPLFKRFYESLGLPNLMAKTHYHTLAPYIPVADIDTEVRNKLDTIHAAAERVSKN